MLACSYACFDGVGCGGKVAAAAAATSAAAVVMLLLMAMTTHQHLRKQSARRGLHEEEQLETGAAGFHVVRTQDYKAPLPPLAGAACHMVLCCLPASSLIEAAISCMSSFLKKLFWSDEEQQNSGGEGGEMQNAFMFCVFETEKL